MSSDAYNQSNMDVPEKLLFMSKHTGLRRYCLTRQFLESACMEITTNVFGVLQQAIML